MRFQKSMISVIAVLSIALASGCGQNPSQEKVGNGSESTQEVTGSTNTSKDKVGSTTTLYR
ncbi:hypothetical protein ACINKY_17495 [Paenibacillus illinoisensis]|uniref:Uncharacterized protein n=1 Tax=Paenibacillus illinoisensis TaxID=59845 RepID=A0ABW8HYE9_9BACL